VKYLSTRFRTHPKRNGWELLKFDLIVCGRFISIDMSTSCKTNQLGGLLAVCDFHKQLEQVIISKHINS
jgi:hypothetical protein